MKKYIIPETMVVEANEPFMLETHSTIGSLNQLNNGGFFDDQEDDTDISFDKGNHFWDEDNI